MEATVGRDLRRAVLVVFAAGLIGCTTNITPPSGPVGTEVCFDPAPFTSIDQLSGALCPWDVVLWPDDDLHALPKIYSDDKCFNIPSACLVGHEYTIQVSGRWGLGCDVSFQPAQWLSVWGSFVVTE